FLFDQVIARPRAGMGEFVIFHQKTGRAPARRLRRWSLRFWLLWWVVFFRGQSNIWIENGHLISFLLGEPNAPLMVDSNAAGTAIGSGDLVFLELPIVSVEARDGVAVHLGKPYVVLGISGAFKRSGKIRGNGIFNHLLIQNAGHLVPDHFQEIDVPMRC